MLSPEEFREAYPPERLADELPVSPVTSLRRIQHLYGTLYTLATAGGGEYASYLTPDSAADIVDTNDSLIVVRVDLSGESPRLATDDRGPVWVTRYTDELVSSVAHCKYPAARGIDHSITHQAGRNSNPEKLARYATERLTKWATDEVIREVADAHEDGWIVDALAALGNDESALELIEDRLVDELAGESTTALLTVQVRLDAEEGYLWPADLDVFLEAMRRRKLSKLVTKNKATDSSGPATDLVTGRSTRTVGTSEDPQNYYLGKQLETFPGLDIEEAWRTHPISEDAAVTVMNAGPFVEACTYRTFGAKVYYLPYFAGRPTPETAYALYNVLYDAEGDDEDMTPVEQVYEESRASVKDFWDRLRFYVSAVMPHQMSRYDVFGETMDGRLLYPAALGTEHDRLVSNSSAFNSFGERSPPLPTNENWELLASNDGRLHSISTGWYFQQTFAERDDDAAAADDPRIEALVNVLCGDPIPVELLLGEYVERIVADQDDDDVDRFPSFRVAGQFAQLCALATDELDLLTHAGPNTEPITREPTYDDESMPIPDELRADGGNAAATKLETFIEDTPALAHDDDAPINDQRRGAFLLGALVGAVGSYQAGVENRSTTLIDQFPVKGVTKARIKKVAQETIDKTLTYTRDDDWSVTKFEHVVEPLRETILRVDPDDWQIDTDDLRFYYALGVTYGMNDRPSNRAQTAANEEHS